MKSNDSFKPDSVVQTITDRFINRAKKGKEKYNADLDRNDLNVSEWIQHLQDEIHDAYLYSEKFKQDSIKQRRLLELALRELDSVYGIDRDWEVLTKLEVEEFKELYKWYTRV